MNHLKFKNKLINRNVILKVRFNSEKHQKERKMDDSIYARNAVKKILAYENNGIIETMVKKYLM